MMFETEESGVRRYTGAITGISDLDPIRWKNSQWRNLQVLFKGVFFIPLFVPMVIWYLSCKSNAELLYWLIEAVIFELFTGWMG